MHGIQRALTIKKQERSNAVNTTIMRFRNAVLFGFAGINISNCCCVCHGHCQKCEPCDLYVKHALCVQVSLVLSFQLLPKPFPPMLCIPTLKETCISNVLLIAANRSVQILNIGPLSQLFKWPLFCMQDCKAMREGLGIRIK